MKSPVFCARKIRAFVSGIVFLTCMAIAFVATPTCSSAQDSQSTSANSDKASKKVKAVQPAKSTNSAKKAADSKTAALPPKPTRYALKQQAEYGIDSRDEGSEGVSRAAKEAYTARAYPAPYVPHQLTVNAQKGWVQFKAAAARTSDPLAAKQWNLVPLQSAEFPNVLTFSGAPYFDSGRITALAISPICHPKNCRLWVAAAGGGIWRTDNAQSRQRAHGPLFRAASPPTRLAP